MSIELGDILKLTDIQEYAGETLLNIYYYEVTQRDNPTSYDALISKWVSDRLPFITIFQVAALTHQTIRVDNITDGLTFAETSVNEPGQDGTGGGPSATAISWRWNPFTKITRPGGKRIGGLSENRYIANELSFTAQEQLNLEKLFFSPLEINDSSPSTLIEPVIVGRNVDGTLDLLRVQQVRSGTLQTSVTTQTTRRAGRGS